jgi:predicted AAA+ superfamily ATPase
MFYQIIDELLKKNVITLENLVYINFSNLLLDDFDVERLLEDYFSLFPDKKPFFFFDEVQELENFDKALLFLQAHNYQVFAT